MLRERLLAATAETFQPEVVLVDGHPFGIGGELGPALEIARAFGAQAVLGLCDVIDDPARVDIEWHGRGVFERIAAYYSRVLVYGQPDVLDPVRDCGFPVRRRRAHLVLRLRRLGGVRAAGGSWPRRRAGLAEARTAPHPRDGGRRRGRLPRARDVPGGRVRCSLARDGRRRPGLPAPPSAATRGARRRAGGHVQALRPEPHVGVLLARRAGLHGRLQHARGGGRERRADGVRTAGGAETRAARPRRGVRAEEAGPHGRARPAQPEVLRTEIEAALISRALRPRTTLDLGGARRAAHHLIELASQRASRPRSKQRPVLVA